MSSTPARIRRRARKLARRGAAHVARVAPVGVGPQRWQQQVLRAKLTSLSSAKKIDTGRTDADQANRADLGALVRRGATNAELDAATLVALHGGAITAGDTETATGLLERLLHAQFVDQRTLDRTITAVRKHGTKDQATRLLDSVQAQQSTRVPGAPSELLDVVHGHLLEDAFGGADAPEEVQADAITGVLGRIRAENPAPLRPITRVLTKFGAWERLADEVDTELAHLEASGALSLSTAVPAEPDEVAISDTGDAAPPPAAPPAWAARWPEWLLAKATTRAQVEGYLSAAGRLARARLVLDPENDELRTVEAATTDALALTEQGWPTAVEGGVDPSGAEHPDYLAYERRPRAVLSLLGQSLPLRSGGYATRSHGILTALTAQGWSMRAATRLGFPYDLWWKADDPRTVEPVDVVDGVPYHRLLIEEQKVYPRVPLLDYVQQGASLAADLGREHGASLVHASSLHDVGLLGLETAARLDVPFIYEMRGLKQLLDESRLVRFRGSEQETYLERMELTVATRADRLLVITRALGEEMVRLGVDPDRIVVVPNGVHVARFQPRPPDEELRTGLGIGDRTVIGYVGSLVNYEGLDLLLESIDTLRTRRDDFHLLIVGDGISEKRLHRIAQDRELDDWVTFTGRVPHDEVERYLSLVDIAPFPRLPQRVSELISPIKPFESMAMEKAVVVSDVAALTEIVEDGVTGRSFHKGDAEDLARVLDELISDPAARQTLGAAARAWVVEHHDWATITERIDATYREVLGISAAD